MKEDGEEVFCCLRCFRWKNLQSHQEMLWCCGKLCQEEEKIGEDENGQTKCQGVGTRIWVISSGWGTGDGTAQGWVSFPESQERKNLLLYNNSQLGDL